MGDQNLNAPGERQKDRYELGVNDVSNVDDLAPESQVGPSRAHREQQRLAPPSSAGLFEEEAVNLGTGIAAPLMLNSATLQDGGGRLAEYQAGYDMYSAPLRSTVRAMGRVKDVSLTGAPKTPAELRANPGLLKRFRKLSLAAHEDAASQTAFSAWGAAQSRMSVDTTAFGAGQIMLKASLENWHSVQALLQQRRAEATRGAKQAELHEIEEAAATCAKIVEFSAEAWAAVGEISEAMEVCAAFDSGAEKEVLEEGEDVRTKTGRALDRGQAAAGIAKDGSDIVRRSYGFIQKATGAKLSMTLEDVFVVAMGNGQKKLELENEITKLTGQISNLKMAEADFHIKEGRTRLDGFKLELATRTAAVQTDRRAARAAASDFNQSLSGGNANEGQMAMYMAEAQQELAQFGRFADQQRSSLVDPHWRWADAYINDNYHRLVGMRLDADAESLVTNLGRVRSQRIYFAGHLPEWEQNAHAWRQFLQDETQKPLNDGPSALDRKSEAP